MHGARRGTKLRALADRRAISVAIAAIAGVCSGCGPDPDAVPYVRTERCPAGSCPSDAGTADTGPVTIPDEPLEDWDLTGAGPLSGIFAVEAIVTARVVIQVETRQLFRLRLVQKGAEIRQKVTLCSISLPSVEGVAELGIPPELGGVIREKSVETSGPFLSSDVPIDATYQPPPSLIVAGASLGDPASDPLPTPEQPETAVDEDVDGNPGVTVLAKTVTCEQSERLYVALRTGAALSGTVESFDRIEGLADASLDQSVLGYSHDCLSVASGLKIQVEPDSPFSAVRVGDAQDVDRNGNVSCPEITLAAAELFGDYWRSEGG